MSDSNQFNSGSLFLFATEGLLSRCDVRLHSISAWGIHYSFSRAASQSFGQVILSCYSIVFLSDYSGELDISLDFHQGTRGSLKLWWSLLFNCTGVYPLEMMGGLVPVLLQFVGLYSLVAA